MPTFLIGQTKLNVVSKTAEDVISWSNGLELVVTGERAEIVISSHAYNTIEYEVKFISKHPDRNQATKEVEYHKWVTDRIGKKLYLRNYIEVPTKGTKPEGNLKTVYEVKVPIGCPVNVQNYFGKIELKGISSGLSIQSDFAKVFLNDIQGAVDIKTKFGDVTADQLNGVVTVNSNRGDLVFSNISGSLDLEVSTAEVSFKQAFEINQFSLTTIKSNVSFAIENLNQLNFEAIIDQVTLDLPDWISPSRTLIKGKKEKLIYQQNRNTPTIQLDLQYGKLSMFEQVGSN